MPATLTCGTIWASRTYWTRSAVVYRWRGRTHPGTLTLSDLQLSTYILYNSALCLHSRCTLKCHVVVIVVCLHSQCTYVCFVVVCFRYVCRVVWEGEPSGVWRNLSGVRDVCRWSSPYSVTSLETLPCHISRDTVVRTTGVCGCIRHTVVIKGNQHFKLAALIMFRYLCCCVNLV